jgi:hypothetical protein
MFYAGEFQRNNPFSFQAPAIFSPWVDRLLIDLRRRLLAKSQNATSVRCIVKLLDGHLNEVARFALENQNLRAAMVELLVWDDQKCAFLSAETPEQVRASISDHDPRFSKGYRAQHFRGTPPGHF